MADASATSLIERAELILSRTKEMSDAIWAHAKSHSPENVQKVAEAWVQLRPAIIEVGNSLPPEPNPVTDWIREVARVSKWLDDKLKKQSLADVLFYYDGDNFILVYEKGVELFKSMEAKQDPFAFVDGPGLTLLDRFPATPAGHLKFLESVRDEVHNAAKAKRDRLQHGYPNATIESMVSGINWAEAGRRASMLTQLPADVVEQIDLVLRRELNIGTVEQLDEWLTPAIRNLRDAWEYSKNEAIPSSTNDGQVDSGAESNGKDDQYELADAAGETKTPSNSKRSTERGEGQAKLIAALTTHHEYSDGGCLNLDPIGSNDLARLAGVSGSTASAFFKKKFGGHTKYRAMCSDATRLIAALKLLNQEFAPHHLYGTTPPGEDAREG